jgi:hypothetical protein
MRPLLLLLLGIGGGYGVLAQQSYTYRFGSSPFTSEPAGGPTLQVVDTVIAPVTVQLLATTCADMPLVDVAHFSRNGGLALKSFVQDTYSVELVFRLDSVTGRRRIIDFSNGTADAGLYCDDGCLSFYPFSIPVGPCPGAFNTTDFQHLVITSASGSVKVYLNGQFIASTSDMAYYVGPAPNDSIRFFHDDAVAPNEAASGSVALIRVMDQALALGDVSNSYFTFCSRLAAGFAEPAAAPTITLGPNPAIEGVWLNTTSAPSGSTRATLYTAQGAVQRIWTLTRSTGEWIPLQGLPAWVYMLELTTPRGARVAQRLVKGP